jgi:hypothetical protein
MCMLQDNHEINAIFDTLKYIYEKKDAPTQ